jgi:hypothetical protein
MNKTIEVLNRVRDFLRGADGAPRGLLADLEKVRWELSEAQADEDCLRHLRDHPDMVDHVMDALDGMGGPGAGPTPKEAKPALSERDRAALELLRDADAFYDGAAARHPGESRDGQSDALVESMARTARLHGKADSPGADAMTYAQFAGRLLAGSPRAGADPQDEPLRRWATTLESSLHSVIDAAKGLIDAVENGAGVGDARQFLDEIVRFTESDLAGADERGADPKDEWEPTDRTRPMATAAGCGWLEREWRHPDGRTAWRADAAAVADPGGWRKAAELVAGVVLGGGRGEYGRAAAPRPLRWMMRHNGTREVRILQYATGRASGSSAEPEWLDVPTMWPESSKMS